MSTRILYDSSDEGKACFYEGVSDQAFGPVVYDQIEDDAVAILTTFMASLPQDPARYPITELTDLYWDWINNHTNNINPDDGTRYLIGDGEVRLTTEERAANL